MKKDIKKIVKDTYTQVLTKSTGCCSPKVETTFHQSYDHLEGYVPEADYNLGCGLPTEFAKINAGDTVLDLGSGAGNDVFVARTLTGATGSLIGVDMTEKMIEKANENKAKLGYENVEFRLGDIEALPVEDDSVDVIISNCVLNLVPDKQKAFSEMYRVLKPGGHFSVSDIVIEGTLTEAVREAAALYAGCVSGALTKAQYLENIEEAAFVEVEIQKEREIALPDELLLQHLPEEEVAHFRNSGAKVLSINVFGKKK